VDYQHAFRRRLCRKAAHACIFFFSLSITLLHAHLQVRPDTWNGGFTRRKGTVDQVSIHQSSTAIRFSPATHIGYGCFLVFFALSALRASVAPEVDGLDELMVARADVPAGAGAGPLAVSPHAESAD
jgi:hypothetical protein